jgi:hypothetical protein
MLSTLSHWLQRQLRFGLASRPRRSRNAFRPRLEALEDRWVPTTWKVITSNEFGLGSITWAVWHAHDGDTVEITTDGGAARHITLRHGELFLKHNVTIEADGPGAVIDGDFSSRVFEIARGASVEIDNLFIVDGNAQANNSQGNASLDGDGGAILNEGSLTMQNCWVGNNGYSLNGAKNYALKAGGGIFNDHGDLFIVGGSVDDNYAGAGGGIYNDRGTLVMMDTHMSGNSASGGGGAICNAVGTAELDWATLVFNDGKVGGAVANFGGHVQFDTTDLENNTASLFGGALFNEAGSMVINPRSTLKDNQGVKGGGGIYNELGALYVTGSSLILNTTDGDGGGIYSRGGSVDILDCHLENNAAGGGVGGGIYDHFSKVTVTDSHLDLNSALAGGGIYNDQGQLTVTDSKLDVNFVSFFGGAIANFEGTVLTGSMLITNSAPVGGAIFNSLGTLKVGTTLFHGNGTDTIDGPWIDQGGNSFI